MLIKAINQVQLPTAKEAGQTTTLMVEDYANHINRNELVSTENMKDFITCSFTAVNLVAVQYARPNGSSWFAWELEI